MPSTIPILRAGLVFQGRTASGDTVHLWAKDGYWHAAYHKARRLTTEPVPADAIPALLAAWGVEPVAWISWRAPPAEDGDR